MSFVTRRQVLFGGALTVFWSTCLPQPSLTSRAKVSGGCWISAEDADEYLSRTNRAELFESGEEQLEPRSGNKPLDRALAQSLAMISRSFGVLPAFSYYDDSGQPNAKATPEAKLDRADGTVLFGITLLRQLLTGQRPDAAILSVCAHEFGHIASYKNGMIAQLAPVPNEPFRAEQFADYMAGYFAGLRKKESPQFPAVVFATTQRKFGGGDHGTGIQRGEAVEKGFIAAFRDQLNSDAAKSAALKFALARELQS